MTDRRRQRALLHARSQRESWALALAESDREVLRMRDDGMTYAQIATRLGVSRPRARQKYRDALRREDIRSALE